MDWIKAMTDDIIRRLKTCSGLQDVRFVREYGTHEMENPVSGWVAAVSITGTKLSRQYLGGYLTDDVRGDRYTATVELRLYAPPQGSGTGLSEKVSAVLGGLREADSERLIADISASAIRFDQDLQAIYRTVTLSLDFCLTEEGHHAV